MTSALSQPASGTQGLVAIDALDTQPRGDSQTPPERRWPTRRKTTAPMTDAAPAFFVQLSLPETDVARKAYAFAKRATPAFILNHGIRSYVFARAHAAHRGLRPGTDYDDELVFVSCILHDV